jgi:streptogramin lyase
LIIAGLLPLAACSSDDEGGASSGTSASDIGPTTTATDPTGTDPTGTAGAESPLTYPSAGTADESGDQTPPVGTNGVVLGPEGTLWIADGEGNQLIEVDTESGEILARFPAPEGAWPDDLAFDADGLLYWTGFESGQIGRIDPAAGEHVLFSEVPPGANPITFTDDGRLLVGLAVTTDGLYEIDPETGEATQLAAEVGNVNGFDVAADGYLYGPAATGEVVRIDTTTGEVVDTVAEGIGFSGAVREGPDGALYVLVAAPSPTVRRLVIDTGELTDVAPLDTQLVDNMAVTDDGTLYVTTFNRPAVIVVAPDGTTTELTLGRG